MKTKQETFDAVWKGLKSQGFKRSMDPDCGHRCRYRGREGHKCAVGWLIPDDKYEQIFDYVGAVNELFIHDETYPVLKVITDNYDYRLLSDLQFAHDGGVDPDLMRFNLQDVAASHGLTIPEGE